MLFLFNIYMKVPPTLICETMMGIDTEKLKPGQNKTPEDSHCQTVNVKVADYVQKEKRACHSIKMHPKSVAVSGIGLWSLAMIHPNYTQNKAGLKHSKQ